MTLLKISYCEPSLKKKTKTYKIHPKTPQTQLYKAFQSNSKNHEINALIIP